MSPRLVPPRRLGRLPRSLALAALLLGPGPSDAAEPARADARLKGYRVPKGFKVQVAAAEPALEGPTAMAFDDAGSLYVAEWRGSDRAFETWENLPLPEGGTARVRRARKGTTDQVKRLRDADGDGVFESAEVVVEGAEMPGGILPWKNSLYLTCVGRLERWADEDGDGKFETRSVLADGFSALGRHGLSGMTLGSDGWLYLTAGDGDHHAVGSDGSRVDLGRTGGVFRCRPDGSKLHLFASGLRNPRGPIAFDSTFTPFLRDDDGEDGSKFQGTRLIDPVEGGDYGWRLRPGPSADAPDFDRAAVDGERPGKLAAMARLGRGSAVGLAIYNGVGLPDSCRGLVIDSDPDRHAVRGYRVEAKGASHAIKGETTLLAADDDQFRPCQAAIGADGAVYVLDSRGEGKQAGRVYRLTFEGDGATPAIATRPNNWRRIFAATDEQVSFGLFSSPDLAEARRAQRELIDRGPVHRQTLLNYATNVAAPLHYRLLGIQGARQSWDEAVGATMLGLLSDAQPDVRRLAAQAIAWEPRAANPKFVPRLLERLEDPDGRVVREAALAVARHAEGRPAQQAAAVAFRWLLAHPKADPVAREGVLRALDRMGEPGVEEVALAVRTRRGDERSAAVALFSALRSAQAAEQLPGLVRVPDLSGPERLALIRMFAEIPVEIPVPTNGLADFVTRRRELDPPAKVAALAACRLAGNPASALVLVLLDDEDESVRLAATEVAGRSRPPGAMKTLAERLSDAGRSPAERLAILRALRSAGPVAFPAIDAASLASEDPAFRLAALRALAEVDRARATPALQSALAGPDPSLRAEAVRVLGEAPATALLLGRSALDRTLPRADLPAVLAALRKHDGAESRKLLALIEAGAASGPLAPIPSEIVSRAADGAEPWAGLGIFFRETPARCSACHRVEDFGKPDAPLAADLSADKLVAAILRHPRGSRPSPPNVATARTVSLGPRPAAPSKLADPAEALRPDRAGLELASDDVADLAAFLLSKPTREALRHGPRRLDRVLAIGPFDPGADRLRLPLDKVDPDRVLAGQDGAPATWAAREAGDAGAFNLRGEFGNRPGRAYLAVQVKSPRDQAAALRFAVEGGARIYLDGARVADAPGLDPARLAPAFARPLPGEVAPLPGLARLPLKAGNNLLLIALDRPTASDDSALAAFEVASPEPVDLTLPRN